MKTQLTGSMLVLIVVRDPDGRPCAWGADIDASKARKEAEREWTAYLEKFPGTKRGNTTSHRVKERPKEVE